MTSDDRQDQKLRKAVIINDAVQIPRTELQLSFSRSSGPGGQNVNKVSSKVRLRWSVAKSSIPDDVKQRFLNRFRSRITEQGELILTSQRYRDQPKNVADCLDKLQAMVQEVAEAPVPRKKSRRSRASVEKRIKEKKERAVRKQLRKKPDARNEP